MDGTSHSITISGSTRAERGKDQTSQQMVADIHRYRQKEDSRTRRQTVENVIYEEKYFYLAPRYLLHFLVLVLRLPKYIARVEVPHSKPPLMKIVSCLVASLRARQTEDRSENGVTVRVWAEGMILRLLRKTFKGV